jgi:hypothetical protein
VHAHDQIHYGVRDKLAIVISLRFRPPHPCRGEMVVSGAVSGPSATGGVVPAARNGRRCSQVQANELFADRLQTARSQGSSRPLRPDGARGPAGQADGGVIPSALTRSDDAFTSRVRDASPRCDTATARAPAIVNTRYITSSGFPRRRSARALRTSQTSRHPRLHPFAQHGPMLTSTAAPRNELE